MTIPYEYDEEAQRRDELDDWLAEREAFEHEAPAGPEALPPPTEPERFTIEAAMGLPVVVDQLSGDVVAQFLTIRGALAYRRMRELGASHALALTQNPEYWKGRTA